MAAVVCTSTLSAVCVGEPLRMLERIWANDSVKIRGTFDVFDLVGPLVWRCLVIVAPPQLYNLSRRCSPSAVLPPSFRRPSAVLPLSFSSPSVVLRLYFAALAAILQSSLSSSTFHPRSSRRPPRVLSKSIPQSSHSFSAAFSQSPCGPLGTLPQ